MKKRDYLRLTEPLVRKNGILKEASWDEAIAKAAEGLTGAIKKGPTKSYGMFTNITHENKPQWSCIVLYSYFFWKLTHDESICKGLFSDRIFIFSQNFILKC